MEKVAHLNGSQGGAGANAQQANNSTQKPTSVFGLCAMFNGRTVAIPFDTVSRTAASVAYMSHSNDELPHVCNAYTSPGGCGAGESCLAIHVSPDYIQRLARGEDNACCAYCGDPFTREVFNSAPFLPLRGPFTIRGTSFPMERFALTACVQRQLSSSEIDESMICKEHMQGRCSKSKDCPQFHPCRQRYAAIVFMESIRRTTPPTSESE